MSMSISLSSSFTTRDRKSCRKNTIENQDIGCVDEYLTDFHLHCQMFCCYRMTSHGIPLFSCDISETIETALQQWTFCYYCLVHCLSLTCRKWSRNFGEPNRISRAAFLSCIFWAMVVVVIVSFTGLSQNFVFTFSCKQKTEFYVNAGAGFTVSWLRMIWKCQIDWKSVITIHRIHSHYNSVNSVQEQMWADLKVSRN